MEPSPQFDSDLSTSNYQRYSFRGEHYFTYIKSCLKPKISEPQNSENQNWLGNKLKNVGISIDQFFTICKHFVLHFCSNFVQASKCQKLKYIAISILAPVIFCVLLLLLPFMLLKTIFSKSTKKPYITEKEKHLILNDSVYKLMNMRPATTSTKNFDFTNTL